MSETYSEPNEGPAEGDLESVKVRLVTREVEEFLKILHSLLVKRRYGFLRGALELGLWAELRSQITQKQVIDPDSIKEAFDIFLTLDKQEREEMGALAYLAGHEAKIVDDIPLRQQAESLIQALGLEELMEFNLSLGEEVKGTTE